MTGQACSTLKQKGHDIMEGLNNPLKCCQRQDHHTQQISLLNQGRWLDACAAVDGTSTMGSPNTKICNQTIQQQHWHMHTAAKHGATVECCIGVFFPDYCLCVLKDSRIQPPAVHGPEPVQAHLQIFSHTW
jgi:hypothetical protein